MTLTSEQWKSLEALLSKKNPMYLSCDTMDSTFQTIALKVQDHQIYLKNTIPFSLITAFTQAKTFELQFQLFKLRTFQIASDGKDIIFPVQEGWTLPESRKTSRSLEETSQTFHCEILNPMDRVTVLVKTILEMTPQGFSFSTPFDSKLWQVGLPLDHIKIFKNKKQEFQTKGSVAYKRLVYAVNGEQFYQVGVKLTTQP